MPQKLLPPADQPNPPVDLVERRIHLIRGQKVMLDADLAELYQVPTKRLNEAVHRNPRRFPEDFMFQLTAEDAESLRSQFATSNGKPALRSHFVTSNVGRGGRRYLPYAFTEHGVAMLSSVLSSERAVEMNIVIIRAFIKLREVLAGSQEFPRRLEQVETKLVRHGAAIGVLVDEIKKLKQPVISPKRRIGFVAEDKGNPVLTHLRTT
jgi:hypothetical protein